MQYAYYDHTMTISPVIGWFDTNAFYYPILPDLDDLLEMTPDQWEVRLEGYWAVENGQLVSYEPPVPPPTADEVYAEKIADGITITCASNPTLNGVYPIDSASVALVGSIARDAASGLGLPHDAMTVAITDLSGVSHDFDENSLISLYKAERDLVSAMNAQRDIMASGGEPQWPLQSFAI